MKVYKDFLGEGDFNEIKKVFLNSNFPWFYNEAITTRSKPLGNFQFTHILYVDNLVQSNYFNLMKPVINKINCLSIVKIKANLLTKTDRNIDYGFHTDYHDDRITTGILYVNTNNGYTKFKDDTLEKSEENKYVEFNSSVPHSGSSCTDENTRVVINFNYIKC